MDCSPLGSSIFGIFQARILEWVSRHRDLTKHHHHFRNFIFTVFLKLMVINKSLTFSFFKLLKQLNFFSYHLPAFRLSANGTIYPITSYCSGPSSYHKLNLSNCDACYISLSLHPPPLWFVFELTTFSVRLIGFFTQNITG